MKNAPAFLGQVAPGMLFIVRITPEIKSPGGIVLKGNTGKSKNPDRLDWGFVVAAGDYRTRAGNADAEEAKRMGFPLNFGSLVSYFRPTPWVSFEEDLLVLFSHDIYRVLPAGTTKLPTGPIINGDLGRWRDIVDKQGFASTPAVIED